LGADRWRLVRRSLVEVALLSLAGSLGAFVLARWVTGRLSGMRVATDAPVVFDVTADWRVFAFTLVAAVATTLLAGLLPALRTAAVAPHSVLAGGRTVTDRRQHRLRGALVVAQIAVSVLVLVAAGLFARSMRAAQSMELGFRTGNMLTAAFDLGMVRADSARRTTFQRELVERVQRLPGVRGAALADVIPFGYNNSSWRVFVDDPATEIPESGLSMFANTVTPNYFRVAGPALVRGRTFVEADNSAAPRVAVINEAMARRLWPTADPIGRSFRILETKTDYRVVGVAQDAKYMFLGEAPRPFFWRPLSQENRDGLFIEISTVGDPTALEQPLRTIVHDLEPDLPLFDMRTMAEHLRNGRAMLGVRVGAMFGGAFALLALALASVGVYGVVSYAVSNRTREIGIRIALGARMATVMRLVVGQGLVLAAIGVSMGAVVALGVTRVMATLLYGVRPRDPIAFGGAVLVLAIITFLASWLPARRAARLDPIRALRSE
ncbi:MAG TPA: FtsX-like permease family protein, partial [Gemmatimonadaceae bacterium]|nr:FtsX-like permease family protein [Gemmatimonadaceae bacterium]